jgi:hypothetical protein
MKLNLQLTLGLVFSFIWSVSNAQYIAPFAIIKDKDGFANVRDNGTPKGKVIDKLVSNQVFEDENQLGDTDVKGWIYVSYGDRKHKKGLTNKMVDEATGYIHQSRIQYLDKLAQLKKIIAKNRIEFKNDTINILIKTGKFIPKENKISKDKDGFISKINNEVPFGIDGILPEDLEEIKSIIIMCRDKKYQFPANSLIGLFSPSPNNMLVALSDDNTMFLVMSNGDAAGAYNVVWTIKNNIVVSQFVNRDF